jgi:DNA polymerase III epsilon subunit-like protein
MLYAVSLNDRATFSGLKKPFSYVNLGAMCNKLGIVNTNAHDALSDCIAEAEVYRALLTLNLV